MKTTITTLTLASSLLLFSCTSNLNSSRPGAPGGRGNGKSLADRFATNDSNNDGRLDYSEFQQTPIAKRNQDSAAAFKKIDQNGDQYLSKEELKAARKGPRNRQSN